MLAAVRGSETAAREKIPSPRPPGGTLDFSIAPALPAAVVTRDDPAEKRRADANFHTAVRKGDAVTKPPVPATYQNHKHMLLAHVQTVTTDFLSRQLVGTMLAPQALVAIEEWRAMP